MASFCLTLWLVASLVYILNAREEYQRSAKEPEDGIAQMNKNKDCLHRWKRDTKADKLNTFIREYGEKPDLQTMKEKKPQTDFKFRMKMEERLKQLEQQGDMFSLNKLTNRIKKAYEIQQGFERFLTESAKTGKEIALGPTYDKHMDQMNKMKTYLKKLKRKGVPEQSAVNRASDKMMEYWFKHLEQMEKEEGTDTEGQLKTKDSIYRFRREIVDNEDYDPANPYHDPKHPFHFRQILETKLKKLRAENNTVELNRWNEKLHRAADFQREFYEYLNNRTHNDTFIGELDHPGHREHINRMTTYSEVLQKKGLAKKIMVNKIADKNFGYWVKLADNEAFINPNKYNSSTQTPEINLGSKREKPVNRK